MKFYLQLSLVLFLALNLTSCISKKKYSMMQDEYQKDLKLANEQLAKCGEDLNSYMSQLREREGELKTYQGNLKAAQAAADVREEQISDLKDQLADVKTQRDKQLTQVGDLAVVSQSANENIKETLSQLEKKDKYIQLLQEARTKADSINLALAVNLKGVLKEGIEDEDVEIKVDKTVVFINLSDKMLYESGSSTLTPRANEVLGKITQIIKSRPELEVMVEGYTDNVPVKTNCIEDNWDLSVKRATSVVRVLQNNHGIDPNRLIAAGRGEYNTLATNSTTEGRAINRRTRIIILPKLNQFYDLLNPKMAAK